MGCGRNRQPAGMISQTTRAAMVVISVQVAEDFRHIDGQNIVIITISVYEVVSVRPMSSIFKIPLTVRARR